MHKLLVLAFLSFPLFTKGQNTTLSDQAEISIITIGPGNEFTDSFGHSGFRVKDHSIDVVFDYGRFDFNAPNFILKFARGKLNYKLGLDYFSDFYNHYQKQNRTIKEQVLNLSLLQKQKLFNFLVTNEKPENRYYLYDFFYDNCASIIRDVLSQEIDGTINFTKPSNFKPQTFRTLIRSHLNQNSWGSLGIDVALGSVIDKFPETKDYMFLPSYIHEFFEHANYSDSKELVVKKSEILYQSIPYKKKTNILTSPLVIFGVLGFVVLWITYNDYVCKKRNRLLDIILFCSTGLIGVFILLLWFATDHTATAYNYNILWAFAINIVMLKQVWRPQPRPWFVKYIKFLVIALSLLILHWCIGVQQFAIGLLPLLIVIFLRYLFLIHYYNYTSAS